MAMNVVCVVGLASLPGLQRGPPTHLTHLLRCWGRRGVCWSKRRYHLHVIEASDKSNCSCFFAGTPVTKGRAVTCFASFTAWQDAYD